MGLLWIWLLSLFMFTAQAAEVVISCGAVGREFELCRSGAEQWAARSGNRVQVLSAPSGSGERLSNYQLLLAARSPDIDVFVIDTTWPGILGEAFIDLKPHLPEKTITAHFKAFIENNTVEQKLVALPWFIDAGLLYYRKDLLAKYRKRPPVTWQELTATAREIQQAERRSGNTRLWGYVFQARAYEGLTCNALEWIHGFGGGTIVDQAGRVTVNNPRALEALRLASGWVGVISPKAVLNYMEEEARGAFQSGNAVFLRNWPYVWTLSQSADSPVRGKVGISPLPRGGKTGPHAATLGGWSLAVSRFSRHPNEAAGLAAHLASAAEQKRRVLISGVHPTIRSLYDDRELLKTYPHFRDLVTIFEQAVARPSGVVGSKYNQVSAEVWEQVHSVLSGDKTPEQGLSGVERALNRIRRGGRW